MLTMQKSMTVQVKSWGGKRYHEKKVNYDICLK